MQQEIKTLTETDTYELVFVFMKINKDEYLMLSPWDNRKSIKSLKSEFILAAYYVLDMTLKCIWWWDSNAGVWGNMEYSLITINLRSTQTGSGNIC